MNRRESAQDPNRDPAADGGLGERDCGERVRFEGGQGEASRPPAARSTTESEAGLLESASLSAGSPMPGRRSRHEPTPVQRALGLLVRREHSRKELVRKLATRGVEAEAARAAIDRLTADGWQDDARFAESLLRTRANRGYGPIRIQAELGTHGLDRDAIATAMEAYAGDWLENARDLVRRRFGPQLAEDPALQRKAADFLLRRGYVAEHVRAAIRGED